LQDQIRDIFNEVWREQKSSEPPVLEPDTVLLDLGLESLGFAIIVTRLEEELGYDPFSLAEDAVYPQTFGEFVAFYQKYRPAA
jgi:acyl carrier protein